MSNERDELAQIIRDNRRAWVTNTEHRNMEAEQADAILAAGYSKPRTITTAEELDALPEGSIVRSGESRLYVKAQIRGRDPVSWWVTTNERWYFPTKDINLPATVLYEPVQP